MSEPRKPVSRAAVPKRHRSVRFDREEEEKIKKVAVKYFSPPNWSAAVRMLVKKAKA